MKHRATHEFWERYGGLPAEVQESADKCFELVRRDTRHASLHLKKVGAFWSVRVGLHHRAVAVEQGSDLAWFWIGTHAEYDRMLGRRR